MTAIFLLHLMLPLLFIGWIARSPLKSSLGIFCQIVGTAAGLFAFALTGSWLFPPWWTPYAFATLLVAAVFMGWRRRQPLAARLPSGWKDWIFTAVFIAIGGCGVARSANVLAGRVPQADTEVDLAFPLNGGTFLVVNVGSHINVNTHLMTLDANMTRFHKYRGQSMAWTSSKSMLGEFAQRACSQASLVPTTITGYPFTHRVAA